MTDDAELLRQYAAERSEAAFGELVRRHLGLVYHAALRQCGGNRPCAEDVAQRVFADLARKADALGGREDLAGWLYTSTRYAATQAVRAESRRRRREQEAAILNERDALGASDAEWARVRPEIDEALHGLGDRDRAAVRWRFFEDRAYAEIGARLAVSEDAARMRVERALEKLRLALARRGVTSTVAALGGMLAGQAGAAVPAGLAASVTQAALAGAAAGGATAWLTFMSMTKIQVGVGVAVIAALTSGLVWEQHANANLRADLALAQARLADDARARTAPPPAPPAEVRATSTLAAAGPDSPASPAAGNGRPAGAVARGASSVPLAPGMVPVETLGNLGRATPRAAFSTQLWAARTGDVDLEASALTFGAEARAKLAALAATLPESVRAEYGTPEKLMAFVLAGSPHPVGGMQVLGETTDGPDDATLQTEWQHADDAIVQHSAVQLHRDADGWKFVVPLRLVDRAVAYLTRSPPVVPGKP